MASYEITISDEPCDSPEDKNEPEWIFDTHRCFFDYLYDFCIQYQNLGIVKVFQILTLDPNRFSKNFYVRNTCRIFIILENENSLDELKRKLYMYFQLSSNTEGIKTIKAFESPGNGSITFSPNRFII